MFGGWSQPTVLIYPPYRNDTLGVVRISHIASFFPGVIKLDDPLTVLAALEAFIGLLIEVTFIATLTRRLFGQ